MKFDFNAVLLPELEVTLPGDSPVVLHVMYPSEGVIEDLVALVPKLKEIKKTKDAAGIRAIYELCATLLSCNREDITFTKEELRDKYVPYWAALIPFISQYFDFIEEVNKLKN